MTSQERFEAMLIAMVGDDTSEPLDFCDAFELGRLDALDGKPCRPAQYDRPTNQVEYLCGWRDGMHVEDTLDYADDIEEREFIRHGGAK